LTPQEGFHGTVCERLQGVERPQLHLYYRGAYKTTIAVISRALWRAAKDPDHYDLILLMSDLELGKQHLRAIGGHIENNELLRRLYPRMRRNRKDWSEKSKSLVCRNVTSSGPTFELRTIGQSLSGWHSGSLAIDDLVNDENCESRAEQDNLKRRFDYTWPTVDSEEVFITATLYADYDATMHMIRQLYPEELHVFAQPVRGRGWFDEEGKLVLDDNEKYADPYTWDDERLERTRRKISSAYIFRCQYFLDTTQPDQLSFRPEWWSEHVARENLPPLSIYIAVDPASGKGTSRPAIAVVGIDAAGDIYVIQTESSYKSEAEMVEGLLAACRRYNPVMVGVERYGHGGWSTFELLQTECRKRQELIPLTPMTEGQQTTRIRETLRPLYEWGTIFHTTELRGSQYETQLELFPGGTYRDDVDATSLAVILAQRLGFRPKRESQKPRRKLPAGVKRGQTLAQMMEPQFFDEEPEKVTSW